MRYPQEIANPSLRLMLCGFLLLVQGIIMIPRSIEASSSSSSSSSTWKSAPWQGQEGGGGDSSSSSSVLLEQLKYNDLSPTIFSPTGRLHPVEKTMEEVKAGNSNNNVVVALVCQDGILMLSTVPLSPHLNTTTIITSTPLRFTENNQSNNNSTNCTNRDNQVMGTSLFLSGTTSADDESTGHSTTLSSSILPIVQLGPGIVGATAGKPGDSQVLRMRLEAIAQQQPWMDEDDDEDDDNDDHSTKVWDNEGKSHGWVPKLARQLADLLQGPTQKTSGRQGPLLSSAAIVAGHETLWRIDPTGQFWRCQGAVVGRDSDRAEEEILTRLGERMANNNKRSEDIDNVSDMDTTMDLETYLDSIGCDEALELICDCLQEVFWPSSLNLKTLPQGVQLHIPAIPWVAVRVPHDTTTRAMTTRKKASTQLLSSGPAVWRGAFVPHIPVDEGDPLRRIQDGRRATKESSQTQKANF